MLQHLAALIILSIGVILAMPYANQGIQLLVQFHAFTADALTNVFSGGETGNLIRQLITLLTGPIIIALAASIIYWIARRGWFPYFMQCVWIVWFIQTAALVVLSKMA